MRHYLTMVLLILLTAASVGQEKTGAAGKRIPWTTSKIRGTPDPPQPYVVEDVFPSLAFKQPVVLTGAPGTDRLFVAEVGGKIFSFPNDPACKEPDLVFTLKKHPDVTQRVRVYGLTFHPDYAANRYAYLCYITDNGKDDGTRVSRFTVSRTDPPTFDPKSEKVLIQWYSGGHNGGCLKFGPEGYLYIATGDGTAPAPPDAFDTGQDCSDLLSSILRIDVNRESENTPYAVPADNPFVGYKDVRPEIWSFGFRNPWKMSFDRATGDLWVGDVGWELWELVYKVEKGGNYGWSVMEGRQPVKPEGRRGPTPILPPLVDHPHTEAASVTGGFVYRGDRLPELKGKYIYGDYVTGKMWSLDYHPNRLVTPTPLANTGLQIIGFAEDHDGELYLMDFERTGKIYRLIRNPAHGANTDFPRLLSETGLFSDVPTHIPSPGVVPYSINAPIWSDGLSGRRWMAIPGDGSANYHPVNSWGLPEGSVLVKTLFCPTNGGLVPVETQVLHFENRDWRAYSYVWNDTHTDAKLAGPEGTEVTLPTGRISEQSAWRVVRRDECLTCHNRMSGGVLGVSAVQLSRPVVSLHGTQNQLLTLKQMELLNGFNPKKSVRPMVDPFDENADLEQRARSYLHAQCAHCHQQGGGGTATLRLLFHEPMDKTDLLTRPTQGAFGISDAAIVAPGDLAGSVLYYRAAKLGGGRMPRAGSETIDRAGLRLLRQWILNMGPESPKGSLFEDSAVRLNKSSDSGEIDRMLSQLMSSTRGAVELSVAVDEGRLTGNVRESALTLAVQQKPEIRDLFERFLPPEQRVKRLGNNVDPQHVLALLGDANSGRRLFQSDAGVACKSCHQIDGVGVQLGPDLDKIGKKYPRHQILQHILEPSRFIEPKYVSHLVETAQGDVHVGLLVAGDDSEVVLKDNKNKLVRIEKSRIERLVPQSKSMMPELLVRDLTAQQLADLVAYLASLK